MLQKADIKIDAASALSVGERDRQEDALATSFVQGADIGFAVLSDGMGGHASGDVASRIIVSEIFAELTLQFGNPEIRGAQIPDLLRNAARVANDCLRARMQKDKANEGMGGTVVVIVVQAGQLYWLSIGDSPLYLFRAGHLAQLNDDHSLAPQIDLMVEKGLLDPEMGRTHPQRNCLTSALTGGEIAVIDCPDDPFSLQDGDLVIVASDGLQFISDAEIERILLGQDGEHSATVVNALMSAVKNVEDPDQDNISVALFKFSDPSATFQRRVARPQATLLKSWMGGLSSVLYPRVERTR